MTARRPDAGWTFIELTVVLAIIGILAGIAIPQVAVHIERGRAGQCGANRVAMNKAESICFLDGGKTCLTGKKLKAGGYLNAFPECPSDGKYVWRWKNPKKDGYPTMGCSKHYWPKKFGD